MPRPDLARLDARRVARESQFAARAQLRAALVRLRHTRFTVRERVAAELSAIQ